MKRRLNFGVASSVLGGMAVLAFLPAMFSATPATAYADSDSAITKPKADLQVLPAVYYRNLAVYPVRKLQASSGETYITLDEGLKTGEIEVREAGAAATPLVRPRPPQRAGRTSNEANRLPAQTLQQAGGVGGGQVNRLVLYNHSKRKLLLIAGEMVVGGKQDRIVQKDAIIPPDEKPYDLDVFCVEHGRWSGTDAKFGAASLPGALTGGGGLGGGIADPSIRGTAQSKAEQQAVWDEVGKKNSQLGAAGSTTYQAARRLSISRGEDKPYIQELERKVPGKDIVGAIVAVNGKLIWVDQFATSSLFNAYWPKLLQSYVLEAITTRPAKDIEDRIRWKLPTIQEATAYLNDRAGNAKFEGQEGLYKLTRIESKEHVIYELTDMDDKSPDLVHVCKMEKK